MLRNIVFSFACTKRVLVAFVFLVALHAPSWAQTAEELARVEKELAAQKLVAQNLEKKEKLTSSELEKLRQQLIKATAELQQKQSEQEELEDRLSALEKETALRAGVLHESQSRLASLTSALLQLSREPPELFILHEESADNHIHRAILLRSLLPRLKEETTIIAKEIENFESLQEQTASQKRLLSAAQQNLEWQRHNLDQLVKTRQGFLQKTVQEKESMATQMETLANEAKDLRQLMERVSNPSWGRAVGKGDTMRAPSLKAGLKKPASGRIIRNYGEKDDFGVTSDGLTILAAAGSPVVAPQSGRVVFSGPFRGYGKIVILQHTGGFHSFLAGFARIDTETGQTVEAGEPLGVLSSKGQGKPEIYFEWRKGTEPVDPTVGGGKG